MATAQKSTKFTQPLSPHLQIWRWTITMASSIIHRATGAALYMGSLLITAWLAAAAYGEGLYAQLTLWLTSPFGRIILVGFTWSVLFHLANGVRHLFWDAGVGLSLKTARLTAWLVFLLATLGTAALWWFALTHDVAAMSGGAH